MSKDKRYCAIAPAKVILAGEHAVVHGSHALVFAIDLFTRVEITPVGEERFTVQSDRFGTQHMRRWRPFKGPTEFQPIAHMMNRMFEDFKFRGGAKVQITTQSPPASGLGSSASVFVAVAAASLEMFQGTVDAKKIFELAMLGEKVAHTNPSGVDVWISTKGGAVLYRKCEEPRQLTLGREFPMLICLSGVSRSTSTMVETFGRNLSRCRDNGKDILDLVDDIAIREARLLMEGDLQGVGELMTLNHFVLARMGVSSGILDRLVWTALESGSHGAKLTGAGGGGAILALCARPQLDEAEAALGSAGGTTLRAGVSMEGVKAWEEA